MEHDGGLKGIRDLDGKELEAALEAQFLQGSCADWVQKLNAAGAGAHALVSVEDAMDSDIANQRGVSMTREVPGVGMMTHMAPGSYLSRSPIAVGRPASTPGSDAESVLAQIGMLGDIRRLVESGALVTEGVPAR
jgi:crotonobetainyl-CoA:carnitine CoA-transferase CaiB-like acyl-CoA transferase